jgi:hypothetical protein
MAIIASWAAVTGRPAREFWQDNSLRIAGDNGMLGWDDENFDIFIWAEAMQQMYGVEVALDLVEKGDALEFLSKLAIPGQVFASEYESRNLTVPKLSVIHDPKALALRRSGMNARLAGAPLDQHLRGRIMRTNGHAMLVAHQPEWYDRLARDWIEDSTLLLRCQGEDAFTATFDSEGRLRGAEVSNDWIPTTPRQKNLKRFLTKMGRLLSYDEVFMIHVKQQDPERPLIRHKKVTDLRGLVPKAVMATAFIESTALSFKTAFPRWIARMSADRSVPPLHIAFDTMDYRLERWIWSMLVEQKHPEPVRWEDWEAANRVSPFSNVADPVGFKEWIFKRGGAETLALDSPDELGGYAILLVLTYIALNILMRMWGRGSWVGVIVSAFMFYSTDLVRLYSVAALLYWLGTAASSNYISALVPRDPYWIPKRISHMIMAFVPSKVTRCVPWRFLCRHLPGIAGWLAEVRLLWPGQRMMENVLARDVRSVWTTAAIEVRDCFNTPNKIGYISAVTSGGKSTEFVAALGQVTGKQVWLVVPSRLMRDTYQNPFERGSIDVVASGSSPEKHASVVVVTYGQALAHVSMVKRWRPWLVLDEMHKGAPEMIELLRKINAVPHVLASATARHDLYPEVGRMLNVKVPRGGSVKEIRINGSTEELLQRALEAAVNLKTRILGMVVGVNEAQDLADSLTKGGHPTVAVSSISRETPPHVNLIGTAVVYTGVNIRPAPGVGVSTGVELVDDRGNLRLDWTSPSTHKQQLGRLGRTGKAIFFCPERAGTGRIGTPYPNWRLFTSSTAAKVNFCSIYGLRLDLGIPQGQIVGRNADRTAIAMHWEKRVKESLECCYQFLTVSSKIDEAMFRYASWRLTGAMAPGTEQITDDIKTFSRDYLLPQRDLGPIVRGAPYMTIINGKLIAHSGLRLVKDHVEPME